MFNGMMAVQLDFNYVDKYSASTFNVPDTLIPSYIVGNARLGYTSGDDRWEAALFVKNLADSYNIANAYDFAAFGINLVLPNPPRTIGGQVRFNWF